MPIVTLTTDWGLSDFYVGALKGRILSLCPQVSIVDISHDLSADNIEEAAYTVRNAYVNFPAGSVHIVGVDSEADTNEPLVLVEADRHFFICANNGCLNLALDSIDSVTAIAQGDNAAGFRMLSIAPTVVQMLLQGAAATSLGATAELRTIVPRQPVVNIAPESDSSVASIVGHIVHIDSMGNAITNINCKLFESAAQNRRYVLYINGLRYQLTSINNGYADVGGGFPVAFFNSQGLLEIATRYGKAQRMYRLNSESSILIKFQNK